MELKTREESAEYLGVSLSTFKKFQNTIPHIQLGRLVKFDVKDLDAYLEAHKTLGAAE